MIRPVQDASLQVELLDESAAAPHSIPLATVQFGDRPAPAWSPLPIQVPIEALGTARTEVWTTDQAPQLEESHGFQLASTPTLTAGARQVEGGPLRPRTYELYNDLLALCKQRQLKLCRVWNTIPHCLEGPVELLRYMEFCQGRAEAFEQHFGAHFEQHLCAFAAVGSYGGPQTLHFLASNEGGQPVENPRQVSAYRYPRQYGPRSPSFARALRLPEQQGSRLLISGTASIVGYESVHIGSVRAQTRETVRNLRELLSPQDAFVTLKAYLRHTGDLPAAREILEEELGATCEIQWLHADLCRTDLLIEIEGVAGPR